LIGGELGEDSRSFKDHSLAPTPPKGARDPFSPGCQRLLKLVLLPGLSPSFWSGPDAPPRTLTELARLAGITQPFASIFREVLTRLGYMKVVDERLSLVEPRRLLDDWATALSTKETLVHVRSPWTSPGEAPLDSMTKRLHSATFRYAVGSREGCRLLGLERSNVRRLRLYVEDLPAALDELQLSPSEDSGIELIQPRAAEAVFESRVSAGGLWAVDALQCYLDVRLSPARGHEQATSICEKILLPHFRERGWA
jgi:hypothetical protein